MIEQEPIPETTEQDRQERLREKERKIALYGAFRATPLRPVCSHVYYPACGTDDAAVEAFADCTVTLLDVNPDALRRLTKSFPGGTAPAHVRIVEGLVNEYDPGPFDVLLLHGVDHDMSVENAIRLLGTGGHLLTTDASADFNSFLARNPDLAFVGIIRLKGGLHPPDSVPQVSDDARAAIAAILQECMFEPGLPKHVLPVETDKEYQVAHPRQFRNFYRQRADAVRGRTQPYGSVIEFAKAHKISLPPKDPRQIDIGLWIFRKK